MGRFKKMGNRATLLLAGFSLVLFSLTIFENSNTDAREVLEEVKADEALMQ